MKATIKRKLPDVPREATKAVRILDRELNPRLLFDYEFNEQHAQQVAKEKALEAEKAKEKEKDHNPGKRGKDSYKRPKPRPWTEDDIIELIRLRKSGLSHRQIAAIMNRSNGNINNRLKRCVEEGRW